MLVRLNGAHGTAANVIVLPAPGGLAFMHVLRPLGAGQELLWDYGASTDNPDDPLAHVHCCCGGQACEERVLGGRYQQRGCPGWLLEGA